jgi:hypothetical protein
MGTRADALADRIEQGAAALAAYAEQLAETDWTHPVPPDGRTVAVMVHHVASMYPLEVQLAQGLASGQAISGVTWGDVAKMNAEHAQEHAHVTRRETIDLLRRNAKAAADAVRGFTDADLDSAAPVSLNGDAPLTAQFFIEDHALRHSFHHLAKIKAALKH